MTAFPWIFLGAGTFGILATRIGWYDKGGPMRRLDLFGMYELLDERGLGGGARRANYGICAMLILVGLIVLLAQP